MVSEDSNVSGGDVIDMAQGNSLASIVREHGDEEFLTRVETPFEKAGKLFDGGDYNSVLGMIEGNKLDLGNSLALADRGAEIEGAEEFTKSVLEKVSTGNYQPIHKIRANLALGNHEEAKGQLQSWQSSERFKGQSGLYRSLYQLRQNWLSDEPTVESMFDSESVSLLYTFLIKTFIPEMTYACLGAERGVGKSHIQMPFCGNRNDDFTVIQVRDAEGDSPNSFSPLTIDTLIKQAMTEIYRKKPEFDSGLIDRKDLNAEEKATLGAIYNYAKRKGNFGSDDPVAVEARHLEESRYWDQGSRDFKYKFSAETTFKFPRALRFGLSVSDPEDKKKVARSIVQRNVSKWLGSYGNIEDRVKNMLAAAPIFEDDFLIRRTEFKRIVKEEVRKHALEYVSKPLVYVPGGGCDGFGNYFEDKYVVSTSDPKFEGYVRNLGKAIGVNFSKDEEFITAALELIDGEEQVYGNYLIKARNFFAFDEDQDRTVSQKILSIYSNAAEREFEQGMEGSKVNSHGSASQFSSAKKFTKIALKTGLRLGGEDLVEAVRTSLKFGGHYCSGTLFNLRQGQIDATEIDELISSEKVNRDQFVGLLKEEVSAVYSRMFNYDRHGSISVISYDNFLGAFPEVKGELDTEIKANFDELWKGKTGVTVPSLAEVKQFYSLAEKVGLNSEKVVDYKKEHLVRQCKQDFWDCKPDSISRFSGHVTETLAEYESVLSVTERDEIIKQGIAHHCTGPRAKHYLAEVLIDQLSPAYNKGVLKAELAELQDISQGTQVRAG
jgi:hypothetical protein